MDENRRRTLVSLIELASGNSVGGCWDDTRAAELLRSESTPEELRELNAPSALIDWIFSEEHER